MAAVRYNNELVRLILKFNLSNEQVSNLLGVSEHTVKAWLRSDYARGACCCPKFRVDALKLVLGEKMPHLSPKDRAEIMEIIRSVE